jgi:hypothetical protein
MKDQTKTFAKSYEFAALCEYVRSQTKYTASWAIVSHIETFAKERDSMSGIDFEALSHIVERALLRARRERNREARERLAKASHVSRALFSGFNR